MATATPNQNLTGLNIGRWIGCGILIILGIAWLLYTKATGGGRPSAEALAKSQQCTRQQQQPTATPITRLITITKQWSDIVVIEDGGPRKSFIHGVKGDNVPYIKECDGGSSKGGWEEIIPARDNTPPDYVPSYDRRAVAVRFKIAPDAPVEHAQLFYKLVHIAQ